MKKNLQALKIIFIGTPEFGATVLEELIKGGFPPILVITETDKPSGRKQAITPPPVKITAQKYDIPVLQPKNIKNLDLEIKNLKPDLGILAAYGQILPKNILEIPKFGFLNVHPSLLPKYRGATPVQSAILNGDKETGLSIMAMNEKMDEGHILAQKELQITSSATFKELEEGLAKLGGKLLIETIPKWLAGEIQPTPQDQDKATYTKILTKKDGLIDLGEPAEIIERKIRAFTPWPGAYTFINGKRIIITGAELNESNALKIKRVRPEGKDEMDFKDYTKSNPESLSILSRT